MCPMLCHQPHHHIATAAGAIQLIVAMLIIHTVPEAIGLMLVGIFLLGTWPAVWHQVEQSGRLPSHTFMDYSLTYLAFAAACALTLGQLGPLAVSPLGQQSLQFLDQLQQDNWQMVLFAIAGGICLALGDLALQYSLALCGLSVGPPILSSITLIVGVVLAYFLDGGINKPQLVFTGAAFAAVAVGLGAAAHVVSYSATAAVTTTTQATPTAAAAAGPGSGGKTSSSSGSSKAGGQQLVIHNGNDQQPQLEQQHMPAHTREGPPGLTSSCRTRNSTGSNGSSSGVIQNKSNIAISSSGGVGGGGGGSPTIARLDSAAADAVVDCSSDCGSNECGSSAAKVAAKDCELGLPLGSSSSSSSSSATTGCVAPADQQLQQKQQQRSISNTGGKSSMYLGLAITVVGGIIYGCFMPAFQIAANDPFKLLPPPTPPLSVYTTYFYFAVGFTSISVIVNAWLMYRPPMGIQPSSLTAYLTDHKGRGLSIFSGLLAASGDLTQFIGGQTAGYAAAMMVMAYPVVGVLWGLLRLREFRPQGSGPGPGLAVADKDEKKDKKKQCGMPSSLGLVLVLAQVVLYVLSVGLLSGSAELRTAH